MPIRTLQTQPANPPALFYAHKEKKNQVNKKRGKMELQGRRYEQIRNKLTWGESEEDQKIPLEPKKRSRRGVIEDIGASFDGQIEGWEAAADE